VSAVPSPRGAVVVGLMSGTSLDGISAAAARFTEGEADGAGGIGALAVELLAHVHRPYARAERERLAAAMLGGPARDACRLHVELGGWLADAALAAMAAAGLSPREVAAVASHGQTLWHEPGHSTWQIGDAATIAERTGCAVVSDFRARDVAAGGQGAPLVPMADALLFAHHRAWRALQNLGGIGNVTVVPPAGRGLSLEARLAATRAFDTGPGVVLVDEVVRRLVPALPYDVDGRLALAGRAVPAVVEAFLADPWFAAPPPKTTGRERFSPAFIDRFVAACRDAGAGDADVVATAVACTARSIADQLARFVPEPVEELLLSGGGARNPALVAAITQAVAQAAARATAGGRASAGGAGAGGGPAPVVRRFDAVHFDGDAKEAVAFALLGYLHLTGRAGNVPSATGARVPRVLGAFTPASPS
jgi:anhydro-N-acetylmuramic acid kinase